MVAYNANMWNKYRGAFIFILPLPPQKYEVLVGWLGKIYDDFLRKNANIRGKRWKNGRKGEIFTVLGRKNVNFEKRGWGKNILIWANL